MFIVPIEKINEYKLEGRHPDPKLIKIKKMAFKIIKKKDLNQLLEYKQEYFELERELANIKRELDNLKRDYFIQKSIFLTEFRIKRALVGKRGIGKTHFIKNTILPKLKNYFIIDPNNEYDYVSPENKLVLNRHMTAQENKDMVIKSIGENLNKTIIIDDFFLIDFSPRWFFEIKRDLNFIIVLQNFSQIKNYTEKIDYFYNFGTIEEYKSFEYKNENKILNINQ